jgi:prepilin-type processing-associated H-X9-DG protein
MWNYDTTHSTFPAGSCSGSSYHVRLLPYLEKADLYQRVQFDDGGVAFLKNVPIQVLICPSDATPAVLANGASGLAGTNYAGCSGVWAFESGFDGVFNYCDLPGPWKSGFVRPADVTDGTSMTIAVSEILRASGEPPHRLRTFWNTPHVFVPGQIDEFAQECASVPHDAANYGWRGDAWTLGTPWSAGGLSYTLYSHVLTPNQPSCANRSGVPNAATTAASLHPGGVQSLFADGHIEFVPRSISPDIWRKKASRADIHSP